jgi:hypothetical protein
MFMTRKLGLTLEEVFGRFRSYERTLHGIYDWLDEDPSAVLPGYGRLSREQAFTTDRASWPAVVLAETLASDEDWHAHVASITPLIPDEYATDFVPDLRKRIGSGELAPLPTAANSALERVAWAYGRQRQDFRRLIEDWAWQCAPNERRFCTQHLLVYVRFTTTNATTDPRYRPGESSVSAWTNGAALIARRGAHLCLECGCSLPGDAHERYRSPGPMRPSKRWTDYCDNGPCNSPDNHEYQHRERIRQLIAATLGQTGYGVDNRRGRQRATRVAPQTG